MSASRKIVVIGGTACGPKAAARARRCDQSASITMIEQRVDVSQATCGLPYYTSGVISKREDMVARTPDYFESVMNIAVLTATRAVAIQADVHKVQLADIQSGEISEIEYDKLVLATGTVPNVLNVEGKDLGGIFTLATIIDATAIRKTVTAKGIKSAVIVGAGLIGLEMAEAFVGMGLKVTVVESLDWVLPRLLDFEAAAYLEKHLRSRGVDLLFGQRVTGFEGDGQGWVSGVVTRERTVPAQMVLLALGGKPNSALASAAGLRIGPTGGIAVNEELQTSHPDIYAGGDCVENVHLITRQPVLAPMGSTANKHGRVIGTNITGGHDTFPGVLGTAVAKVFDYSVARVGLSQLQAEEAGYRVVTALVPAHGHASYYPGSREILVKLIASAPDGRLLGGQVLGAGEAAKRIDVLATCLTLGASLDTMANLDLAYAPPYNSALDPLHNATNVIRNKLSGHAQALTPMEVKKKLDDDDDFVLLDVRSPREWEECRIEAPAVKLIPLTQLRSRLDELPRDKEIVIYCRTSVRAYQAQRILQGAGFYKVYFMDGSLHAWPFETACKKPE